MNLGIITLAVFATFTPEQPAQPPPPIVEKMNALQFMLGEWSGEGWIGSMSQRNEFRIRERIQSKLGGRVFLIEGSGTAKIPGEADGPVVHEAFAVLTWDVPSNGYIMRAFKADGAYVEAKVEVEGRKLVWGFDVPAFGAVRFTLEFGEDGQWAEFGEMRRGDAEKWTRFLEMNLTKPR